MKNIVAISLIVLSLATACRCLSLKEEHLCSCPNVKSIIGGYCYDKCPTGLVCSDLIVIKIVWVDGGTKDYFVAQRSTGEGQDINGDGVMDFRTQAWWRGARLTME